ELHRPLAPASSRHRGTTPTGRGRTHAAVVHATVPSAVAHRPGPVAGRPGRLPTPEAISPVVPAPRPPRPPRRSTGGRPHAPGREPRRRAPGPFALARTRPRRARRPPDARCSRRHVEGLETTHGGVSVRNPNTNHPSLGRRRDPARSADATVGPADESRRRRRRTPHHPAHGPRPRRRRRRPRSAVARSP
ncbi:MAG: hypothetical protein GY938_11095, partial [Ketobacter sp.]|nr:hypothetical protein [Ketobacter sp.]